jgi:hypothetical protein
MAYTEFETVNATMAQRFENNYATDQCCHLQR